MDISLYLRPLLRMWWLLIAATVVAAISTFITLRQQPTLYQAKTTLMIGRAIDDPNPSSGEFFLAQQLASAYADVANRKPVRDATMEALGLDALPQYYAQAIPQTQLIEILVTDFVPLRAQVVANELANQLIQMSPTGERSEEQARQEFIDQQLNDLQAQIVKAQDDITALQETLGTINSASELADTQNQIAVLQQKLTTLQATYATLLSNTQQGATNTLIVVESAELPTAPLGPNKIMLVMLAAGIGFILAAGAIYLLDYLDDTLKTPEDITRALGLPVLGFIGETRDPSDDSRKLHVSKYPRSHISEAYRSLRANLKFLSDEKPIRSLLITSTNIGAGKTSVASNLAAVFAQGGKRVILLDADLRRPRIHEYLKIPNDYGLTDVIQNGLNVERAIHELTEERISVIVGGQTTQNPTELLASERMDLVIRKLESTADMVIIDSAPFLVTDSIFLADKVDGILIVLRPGHVHRKIAQAMVEQLRRADARILGVVLNRIPGSRLGYYEGYSFISPYSNGHYYEELVIPGVENSFSAKLTRIKSRIAKVFGREGAE